MSLDAHGQVVPGIVHPPPANVGGSGELTGEGPAETVYPNGALEGSHYIDLLTGTIQWYYSSQWNPALA